MASLHPPLWLSPQTFVAWLNLCSSPHRESCDCHHLQMSKLGSRAES